MISLLLEFQFDYNNHFNFNWSSHMYYN